MHLSKRMLPAVLALSVTVALTGCSADTPTSSTPSAKPGESFPVEISHVYGTTEIPDKPERIVTIGWMTQDIVAALGTTPVGVSVSWGGDEQGFTPWFREQVEQINGDEMPQTLTKSEEPDFEQILTLAPDLILAPHSGITQTQYKRLSEIAPTVAYQEQPWVSGSWQDLTRLVAQTMGELEKAERLISDTETTITTEVNAHPNLNGTSFIYGLSLKDGDSELGVYISVDPRVALLREFGLVDSPDLDKALGDLDEDAYYGALSLEKLDTVSADLFVGWSGSAEETQYTLTHPTFSLWEPIASGHYYLIQDETMGMATNGPTLLSLPWAFKQGFIDDLSAAAEGTPTVRELTK